MYKILNSVAAFIKCDYKVAMNYMATITSKKNIKTELTPMNTKEYLISKF